MKNNNITDRLSFLAESFDVFECDSEEQVEIKINKLISDGYKTRLINGNDGKLLAILSTIENKKNRTLVKLSICSSIFAEIIIADPTENKSYSQWILNLFARLLKDSNNSIDIAIRLVEEDLPQANKYLQLFEENKRKKKFKDLCRGSYSLVGVEDPTDINQYKSLSQLFDAVDPFIDKDVSVIERTMQRFVDAGQALIPVKDRKFTVFIPKTTEASVIFGDFANWCTARQGNGMFKSYTNGHKKPNGKNSDIYIIVNNKFFSGESKELYQIHFETNQLKDRQNGQNVSIFENVISESEGVSNFFQKELLTMAKDYTKGVENNKYLDFLIQFGFAESLFELIDSETPTIRFMTREIPKLPDLSKFKKLDQLIITNAKLVDLHPSIGKLENLEMLVLTENRIKTLPKEIGLLKNLRFLNIIGNPISEIPTELKYLDKSNGGSLGRIGVKIDDIGVENYNKLKELLPTTILS
jgi:hypothetical protein